MDTQGDNPFTFKHVQRCFVTSDDKPSLREHLENDTNSRPKVSIYDCGCLPRGMATGSVFSRLPPPTTVQIPGPLTHPTTLDLRQVIDLGLSPDLKLERSELVPCNRRTLPPVEGTMSGIVRCEVCGKIFNRSYLGSHRRLAHPTASDKPISPEGELRLVSKILSLYQQLSLPTQKQLCARLAKLSQSKSFREHP